MHTMKEALREFLQDLDDQELIPEEHKAEFRKLLNTKKKSTKADPQIDLFPRDDNASHK